MAPGNQRRTIRSGNICLFILLSLLPWVCRISNPCHIIFTRTAKYTKYLARQGRNRAVFRLQNVNISTKYAFVLVSVIFINLSVNWSVL